MTDTFDNKVNSTEPDNKYNYIVSDILRDKKSGWSLKYYEDNRTSWDPAVGRTRSTIARCNSSIISNQALLEKQTKDLELSRLPKDHKDYKPLTKQEKKHMDAAYVIATDEINSDKQTLRVMEPYLEDALWSQFVESRTTQFMRYIRNKFMIDGDLDFLKRGVTWVYNYAKNQRDPNSSAAVTDIVSPNDVNMSAW